MDSDQLIQEWRTIPTEFESGLSEEELQHAEGLYSFEFPPDLRRCLGTTLPVGESFPNWRMPESVEQIMSWPWRGLVFDLVHDSVWPAEWGPRPRTLRGRLNTARQWYESAPKLIPVFGHRYLAAIPSSPGNPVLSVYQTDIIYYNADLADWIRTEFHGQPHEQMHDPEVVPAWSQAMRWRDEN